MEIINTNYFPEYAKQVGDVLQVVAQDLDFKNGQIDLGYSMQASAVYSANIEGNTIDLNSFMNYKLSQEIAHPTKEIEEIENLIAAYEFAQKSDLNEENLLEAHRLFSKTLLIKEKRGTYRTEKVGVFGATGLVYLAIEPEFVVERMAAFFENIAYLLKEELSLEKTFYFASLIHLVFAHIHPFADGNGRAARLLEKWFLAQKLGENYWKIPSEKYYKEHQSKYYENINLGVNYYEVDYDRCLPFLLMLPSALKD